MPLPALPQNNTTRYFVDYTTGRYEHTLVFRTDEGVGNAEANTAIYAVLEAIGPILPNNWQVVGCRLQLAGELFSLPVSLGDVDGFVGTSTSGQIEAKEEPRQLNFVGRSRSSGRQVRLGFYGAAFTTPGNYRLATVGLSGVIGNTVDALNAASFGGVAVAIDGAYALWKSYANVNYNSYWETEARG